MRTLLVTSLVAGALAALGPQDASESRPSATKADPTVLRKALTAVLDAKGFRLSGDVAIRNPEDSGSSGAHVMVLGAGAGGPPFTGGLELERTAKGELFIVSRSKLPGFAIIDDGERAIVSTTFENEPPDTSAVIGDLTALLNLDELVRAGATAPAPQKDAATGATTWTFQFPKRLLKSAASGPIAMAQPRVKAASAAVAVGRDGSVVSLRFSVTRTDPMASIKRRAMEHAADGGSCTSLAGADDMGGDEEGATSVYSLKPATGEPSRRARKELERLQRAASDEKD